MLLEILCPDQSAFLAREASLPPIRGIIRERMRLQPALEHLRQSSAPILRLRRCAPAIKPRDGRNVLLAIQLAMDAGVIRLLVFVDSIAEPKLQHVPVFKCDFHDRSSNPRFDFPAPWSDSSIGCFP